jgi:hypothetical protein
MAYKEAVLKGLGQTRVKLVVGYNNYCYSTVDVGYLDVMEVDIV